jgi:hypothetical protein
MDYVNGVNLLPSTGEFTYDPVAYMGQRVTESAPLAINTYAGQASHRTDLDLAIDQLVAECPSCTTVAVIVAWFFNSEAAASCKVYPSTTYIGGSFQKWNGTSLVPDHWLCSGLNERSAGLIPISQSNGSFSYGGTPSDQSIFRCIQDLKARGLRVVFYPFLLGDIPSSFPWRGRITHSPDLSLAATAAIAGFLGSCVPAEFTRDAINLTVNYSGSPTDYSFRRMILHYGNLCVIAGGVDLFLLGSELRGLETVRGPDWTLAGAVDNAGHAIWDYPFVAALVQLSDDVRGVFDVAGFTKDTVGLHNLISYAADWSSWLGYVHTGSDPASPNGQWPHLDQLWSHSNIDLVCFDNYLPLSDWPTGGGGLDALNWGLAAPTSWPVVDPAAAGLGLTGNPTIYSKPYLKANIEGGERFNWFYFDGTNLGRGFDPAGSDLQISLPEGDRLAQTRTRYFPGQEILGHKQLRWWWNNTHQALYDNGDGTGETSKGPPTGWAPHSKSIAFTEYGYPSCDRSTNQPNVFFDAKSSESATAYWSIWNAADDRGFLPAVDQTLSLLALQAIHEYWFLDGNNAAAGGIDMIQPAFCSVWNWDARPFPTFPLLGEVWGDAGNWQAGNWLGGKGPFIALPVPDALYAPPAPPAFPMLSSQAWSVHYRPQFNTGIVDHVSGRESRLARMLIPTYEIEMAFDLIRMDEFNADLQTILGFYAQMRGQASVFTFPVPPELGFGSDVLCRFNDDSEDLEEFMSRLFQLQSLKLITVKM